MKTNKPTYEELVKRLAEAEEVIRILQCGQATSAVTGSEVPVLRTNKAEKMLQDKEALYRSIEVDSPAFMCRFLPDGEIVFANAACCEYFGKTSEELVGSNFTTLIPEEDRQKVLSEIQLLTVDSPSTTHEHRVIQPDGRIRWQQWTHRALLDEQDRAILFQSIGEDITERKQKENELRLSESKYKDLVENMVDVIFTLDKTGQVTGVNASVRVMLGHEPEEIVGKHFTEWIVPDQRSTITSIFECVLGGETIIDETVLVGKDGKARNVDFRATRISREGTVIGVQGILRDITESKKATEALRRTEQRYRILFDGAMDAIFVADAQTGILLDCNRAAVELIGREKSEMIGQSHRILHPPQENEEEFNEIFQQHLKEKQGQTLDTHVITKTGEIRDVAIKGNLLEIEGKKVLLGMFRDITVRKKAEADLRKSEERFKQVAENAGDWIWEVDTKGLYTYVNPVVGTILGYKPEEIVGRKHFYDFFAPEVKEDFKKTAFEAFAKREGFREFVNPNVHKNGSKVILETSGTPIIDEKGNFYGYRGVDRDITERTQKEDELRKLNADLVLASRTAGTAEVATDVLHNVGNVLNSINVSAGFIEEKLSNSKAVNLKKVVDILAEHAGDLGAFLTEDERDRHIPLYLTEVAKVILNEQEIIAEKLQSLMKNVEHIKHIIKAQQSYARSGGNESFTSLSEVIEDAIEINQTALERYGIYLEYELAKLPRIRIDKQRVLQILVNLISNAKQALAESEKPQKILSMRSYRHGEDILRIEVADNRIGISKDNLPKIFNHGFTTKKKGHGFGLHSSAVAAREMGGSLAVHSDGLGYGTTFTLELPLNISEIITNECSQ